MRLDVLIFTNEQAWLREVGGAGGCRDVPVERLGAGEDEGVNE